MNNKKRLILGLYLALAITALALPGSEAAVVIHWLFAAVLAFHLLEFALLYPTLAAAPGTLRMHFFQTLLFGCFHWWPLRRQRGLAT